MNEEEVVEAFFRETRPRLVGWLIGLGASPADAEDVAQEAFEEVVRRWPTLKAPDRYLFCVAWNKLIRLLKAQGRHAAAVRILEQSTARLHVDAYRHLEAEDARLLMLVLPPQQRAAFACCYEGMSGKETAERLSKPETTIRSSLRAGRKTVRPIWEDPDTDLNPLVMEQAHIELRGGNASPPGVRPVIRESWKRCRDKYKVDLDCETLAGRITMDRLEELRTAYPFPELEDAGYAGLAHLASTHQMMLAITDADGYVLRTYGDRDVIDSAAAGELCVSAQFVERMIGTNAIGIALEDRYPVYVRPLEHYAESQRRRFACAASPVFDPYGRVIAVVNLTALARAADPRMLEYVAIATSRLQSWLRHNGPAAGSRGRTNHRV